MIQTSTYMSTATLPSTIHTTYRYVLVCKYLHNSQLHAVCVTNAILCAPSMIIVEHLQIAVQ